MDPKLSFHTVNIFIVMVLWSTQTWVKILCFFGTLLLHKFRRIRSTQHLFIVSLMEYLSCETTMLSMAGMLLCSWNINSGNVTFLKNSRYCSFLYTWKHAERTDKRKYFYALVEKKPRSSRTLVWYKYLFSKKEKKNKTKQLRIEKNPDQKFSPEFWQENWWKLALAVQQRRKSWEGFHCLDVINLSNNDLRIV